jgi:hypothetical protein
MTLTPAQIKATAEGRCCRWCRVPLDHERGKWVSSGAWPWCTGREHEPGPYIEAASPDSEALRAALGTAFKTVADYFGDGPLIVEDGIITRPESADAALPTDNRDEIIQRLTTALKVADHDPHDRNGPVD